MVKSFFKTLAFCVLLSSCSIVDIKNQAELLQKAALIQGKTTLSSDLDAPVIALIFEIINGTPHYEGSAYVDEKGGYKFFVTPGIYFVSAYADLNRDGKHQDNEPVAILPPGSLMSVDAGQKIIVKTLDITNTKHESIEFDTTTPESLFYENTGKIVSIDDPIFNRNHYSTGLWHPMEFINSIGGGLFMLQDYDNRKTPILFIHGSNGGPDDWRAVIQSIDLNKFQPWVFYYASGVQLDIVSDTLLQTVTALQNRYQYQRFAVAAHSMGGLVARSFIKKYKEQNPINHKALRLFLTVNSPLGGMETAAFGVRNSPVVIPSWRDVAKGSDFIKTQEAWPWPNDIPYYLFFSFKPGRSDDGVVSLSDQIPLYAQKAAYKIHGFENTHNGTLTDDEFIKMFNLIINKELIN